MGNGAQREVKPPVDIVLEAGDVNGNGKHGNIYCRLHDQHGHQSRPIKINSSFNYDTTTKSRTTCGFPIFGVELWIEPSFGVKECYLQQLEINSNPFPVNRWLTSSTDGSGTPAFIPKYGSILPQDDTHKQNRAKVLEEAQRVFACEVKVVGFAPLSKNVPDEEKFQTDYQREILKNALVGVATGFVEDAVDFINPFTSDKIEEFHDYGQCYEGPFSLIPKGYKDWKSDRRFAMQRLIGVNPNVIELCRELPKKFNGTQEMLAPLLEEITLDDALSNKKLFVVDYEILEGLDTESQLFAPIGMFYLNKSDDLVPLAIQLERKPDAEVFLPTDPSDTWLLAKMLFNVADSNYHETVTHLGFTHLIAESIDISLQQTVAPSHPVSMLLRPHFLYLLPINAAAFETLVNAGGFFDTSLAVGSKGYAQLLSRRFRTWSFGVDGNLPEDLKKRGVDDPKVLPDYHYRDDGMDLYNAIYKYVEEVLNAVYADSDKKFDAEKFKNDSEVHAWAKNMLDPNTFNFKDVFNATITDGFKDFESLVKTVTVTIFICSVQHAAVNFGQYDQYGFPPNYPSKMKHVTAKKDEMRLVERDIVKLLPDFNEAMAILTITNTLSMRATQPLGYFEESYLRTPSALLAVKHFQENLSKISGRIKLRNSERNYPYDYLLPSLIPNAISI